MGLTFHTYHITTALITASRDNDDMKVTRVGGSDNCADLGSKHLDCHTMIRHLKFCGQRVAEGRNRIAPQLEHLSMFDSDEH